MGGMENLDELLASLEEESARKSNASTARGSTAQPRGSSASDYEHLFASDAAPRASQPKGPNSRTASSTIDFDIDQYLNELGQGGGRASTASLSSMNMSARSSQDLSIDDINDLLEDKGRPAKPAAKPAPPSAPLIPSTSPSGPKPGPRAPSVRAGGSQLSLDELDVLLSEAEGRNSRAPSSPSPAPKALASPPSKPAPRESINFDEIDALLEDATSSAKPPSRGVPKAAGQSRPTSSASISMDELDALLDDQLSGTAKSSRRELVSQQMSMDDIDALLVGAGGGGGGPAQPMSPKGPARPKPAGIKPGVRPSQQMDMAQIADLLDRQKDSELNRTSLLEAFGAGPAKPKPAAQDVDDLLAARPARAPMPNMPARDDRTAPSSSGVNQALILVEQELDAVFGDDRAAAVPKGKPKTMPAERPKQAVMLAPNAAAADALAKPQLPVAGSGPQSSGSRRVGDFVPLTDEEIQAKATSTQMDTETIEQALMRIKMDEVRRKDEHLILQVEAAEREARARKALEKAKFDAQLSEAKDIAKRQSQRQSLMPSEPSLYTNSEVDLEEKARHEQEEEKRRLAREEAKFKEHMEKRKLAMVDAILAEEGGTPLLDNSAKKSYFAWNITMRDVLVKERLGVGDTGTSNRGFYKDQAVVIKKLRSPPLTEPWLDTVREEVKKISMLMHPNLSLFLGIAVNGADLFSITEYVAGIPLYGFLRNKAVADDLDNVTILKWAKQIANAMAYLHANRVIHRSLKSKNILCDRDNNLKIRDFSMHPVKDFVDSIETSSNPEYQAPELLARQTIDDRIDVYSFSMILVEMYCKEPVYSQMPADEIVNGVLTAGLRPQIPADCPFVFIKLIESCWQTDPNLRPSFEKIIRILNQPADKLFAYAASK